jgi:NitT/TauT family transport system ATP-binding protein
MPLRLEHVHFAYDGTPEIFRDLNLILESGERVSILGTSGGGKSTLLSVIAGLLPVTQGNISFNGAKISRPSRKHAMIFQNYALFPWLTVSGNLQLVFDGSMEQNSAVKIKSVLNLVGLNEYSAFYPPQLSGGMQQRVAIARALLAEPELLLLDEPFAALDVFHRHKLMEELIRLIGERKFTSIFVTHNLEDAIFFGNRVLVLKNGKFVFDKTINHLKRDSIALMKTAPDYLNLEKEIYDLITA